MTTMPTSALRAKYISLVTDVIYEAGIAGKAGDPDWPSRAATLGVRASDLTAFVEALCEAAESLQLLPVIVKDAHRAWDTDQDTKVGKILIALRGLRGYRADVDKILDALSRLEEMTK